MARFKKLDQFSHLAASVSAGKSPGIKIMLVGLICFVALGVLLFLMLNFSKGSVRDSSSKQVSQEALNQESTMNRVFKENEEKIKELQQTTQLLLKGVSGSEVGASNLNASNVSGRLSDNSLERSKTEWLARERSPTETYSAGTEGKGSLPESPVSELLKTESGLLSGVESISTKESGGLMAHPAYTVAQGELIHATLETAVDSELPGMVRAQVTSPVYSYRGENILIPPGSRLIGQYASNYQNGPASARVFIIWNRIITPSGISMLINSPGADAIGRSGLSADAIDHHFFEIFGQAILFSVLGAGVSTVGVSEESQPNSADQFRASVAGSLQNSASKSLKSNTEHVSPTLHIYQGDSVVIFVSKDLDLWDSVKTASFGL